MSRTRGELEEIIKRGESVILHDGRVITTLEDLPSAVDLAGDDIVKKQQAVADLKAKQAELAAEIARAEGKASAPAETEAEAQPAEEEIKVVKVGRK